MKWITSYFLTFFLWHFFLDDDACSDAAGKDQRFENSSKKLGCVSTSSNCLRREEKLNKLCVILDRSKELNFLNFILYFSIYHNRFAAQFYSINQTICSNSVLYRLPDKLLRLFHAQNPA
jgi:hypothetical protein